MKLLSIIRPINILILSISYALFYYLIVIYFLNDHNIATPRYNYYFALSLLSILSSAAAGYIINDIYDIETDQFNNKSKLLSNDISVRTAYILYFILLLLSIFIGVIFSFSSHKFLFLFLVSGFNLILWLYAFRLKSTILFGNLLVSFSISTVIVIPYSIFFKEIHKSPDAEAILFIKNLHIFVFILSFLLNLIREIIKDAEDVHGDSKAQIRTLATSYGYKMVNLSSTILCLIACGIILYWFSLDRVQHSTLSMIYALVCIILPLLILSYYSSKNLRKRLNYTFISKAMKLIMVFGIVFVLFYLQSL